MQSTENKIISKIYGHGRGWAFSQNDFINLASSDATRKALSRLRKKGTIRSACRGIYDYPKYSTLLKTELSPDMDQVAHAIARKHSWNIMISGNAALNALGLSTQVPAKIIYFSNGPNREYLIGNQTLTFQKKPLKETVFKYRESGIVVQALSELGKENITDEICDKLKKAIPSSIWPLINKDTTSARTWIHDIIIKCTTKGTT